MAQVPVVVLPAPERYQNQIGENLLGLIKLKVNKELEEKKLALEKEQLDISRMNAEAAKTQAGAYAKSIEQAGEQDRFARLQALAKTPSEIEELYSKANLYNAQAESLRVAADLSRLDIEIKKKHGDDIARLEREAAVARAAGDKAKADSITLEAQMLREQVEALNKMPDEEKVPLLFSRQLLQGAQARNEALEAQVYTLRSQLDSLATIANAQSRIDELTQKMFQVYLENPATAPDAMKAMAALKSQNYNEFDAIMAELPDKYRQATKTSTVVYKPFEEPGKTSIWDTDSLNIYTLNAGQGNQIEARLVKVPGPLGFGTNYKIFVEQTARLKGLDWESGVPVNVQDTTDIAESVAKLKESSKHEKKSSSETTPNDKAPSSSGRVPVIDEFGRPGLIRFEDLDEWLSANPKRKRR